MSQEYEYNPLTKPDSIRLIDLKPSLDHNAKVRCSLIHTTLSSGDLRDIFSHYAALSYVWGSAQRFETIWVDEKPLKITSSLFSALRDLRDETRPFFLWADGICINQADEKEKGVQVQMMGRIYAEASNTIIYLGPADLDSKECRCLLSIRDGDDPSDADTLSSLFQNEWFSRVWVFQELVFAKNPWMQWGRTRAKWDAILQKGLLIAPQRHHQIASEMQKAWTDYHICHQKTTLLRLVQARRGLGVSDPRDMVFAHVGFAADSDGFVIDYSKTRAQVFTDFAIHIAKKHGLMAMLELVSDMEAQPRLQDLPSFVPDLSTSLSPIPHFPGHGIGSFGDTTSWTFWGRNLILIAHYQKVFCITSCELLLSQIPPAASRTIASELYNIEYIKRSDYLEMKSKDIPTLKAIWDRIARIWGCIIGDDNIPQLELYKAPNLPAAESFFKYSISLYIILSLDNRYNWNYLKGRALAKFGPRDFALVPAASQEGDLIARLGLEEPNSPVKTPSYCYEKQFVFRPIGYVGMDEDAEFEIMKWAWANYYIHYEEISMDKSIRHCEMVGEAFAKPDGRERAARRTTILH